MLKFAAVFLCVLVSYASASVLAVYAPLTQAPDSGFSLGLVDPSNPTNANAKTIKTWTSGTIVNPLYPNLAYDGGFYNATFVVSYNYGESYSILEVSTINGSVIRNVSEKIGFFSGLQYDTTDNYVYTACLNQNFAWGVCRFTILGKIPMIYPFPDVPINLWGTAYSSKNSWFFALAEKAETYGEVVVWIVDITSKTLNKELSIKAPVGAIAFDDASQTLYGWVNDVLGNTATLYTIDISTGALGKPLLNVTNAVAFGTPIGVDPVSHNVTSILNTGGSTKAPIFVNFNPANGAFTQATSDLRVAGFRFVSNQRRENGL